MLRFVCFGLGCILGVHLINAFTYGPIEAIHRTVIDPAGQTLFFAVGITACFASTTAWALLRRRAFPAHGTTPLTRFASGLVLVILYVASMTLLSLAIQQAVPSISLSVRKTLKPLWVSFSLLAASAAAIELEGFLVQFLRRSQVADGEPSGAPERPRRLS
ncbi:hypothetical protein CA13_09570 [Planctomycetes bacterium CA13]|uniref:Uncharacterized protein n=1 Tax=Novipirellula herctigrandis TaxID=2527986 RepID=A0A5C5YYJ1_9BACT|nr:hypothetical protein CA13_09570 [Planctomycetes bacterium CA13]